MKKNVLVCLLMACALCIVNAGSRACAENTFEASLAEEGLSLAEFESIATYYYLNPQPDKLLSIVKVVLSQEELVKDAMHFNTFAHLVAAVARSDSAFFQKLKNLDSDYTGFQKETLQRILKVTRDFISPGADSPEHLDYLWSEFIATGSEAPVKKIINVLGYPDTGMNMVLIGAAEWSLTSNARHHEKVYSIIQEQFFSASGQTKEKLKKILGEINKK